MCEKRIVFVLVLLCGFLTVKSDSSNFDRDEMWEYLKGVESEADYDSYVKDMDLRSVEKPERSLIEYLDRARQQPSFRVPNGRRYREIYPERDFEGNCPPGYRSDRLGICREIW